MRLLLGYGNNREDYRSPADKRRIQLGEGGVSTIDGTKKSRAPITSVTATSYSVFLGVVPLKIGTGAGYEMRQSPVTAVFFGMLGAPGFGLLFTPVFYVATEWVQDLFRGSRSNSVGRHDGSERKTGHMNERAESLVSVPK